ncbi:hypothetical protein ASPZODRAFT_13930 [Penicilliopsis zonata CBS 506.65]|uniref:SPIN90/Ldb17 leucine-rich domain-containing protein n=1 Tax=Penicilliopsis zonata CBS 506.65 TaxID=1073090 RepID=A0A1L9SQ21_9EURO|nr:hypothetical protein ASPZODRAFT_13930 [Penicilliopsis zonata CBS 506.65]OJJ49201.1 hypothetical protein ASPZODRAFT_13930 [Penicilliopsis zonata CBS 506.65]
MACEGDAGRLEEHQFWDELQSIVSTACESEDRIDDVLRAHLGLATSYKDDFLTTDYDISRCSYILLSSPLFAAHAPYIRQQIIYSLLQEDDWTMLQLIVSVLLFDGQQHEVTLRQMNEIGVFARLLELIQGVDDGDEGEGAGLRRLLLGLLYEMSRIQRVRIEDLVLVDDEFIKCLFEIIEHISFDANDPYHYPVIRVLLVLNEQFMISAHDPVESGHPLTNKVIKILSMHGNAYKTFGENIILLINREGETSLQLLTLKLLYLIFTTPSTYEYFYTNDLHVLVDILIRNLLDLPEEASALRHTYLRVLYPLLAHTQLKYPPYYKREELTRVLSILVHGQFSTDPDQEGKIMHFDEVDETTRRLVDRCATVDWLVPVPEKTTTTTTTTITSSIDEIGDPLAVTRTISLASTISDSPGPASPDPASASVLSVHEVASMHAKPGVMTPSLRVKPEPPKRRWRGRRNAEDESSDKASSLGPSPASVPAPPPPPPLIISPASSSSPSSTMTSPKRRSVSNPPPALPPPRRSYLPNPPPLPKTCTPSPTGLPISPVPVPSLPGTNGSSSSKYAMKPEPPKARRRGRTVHAPSDSSPTHAGNTGAVGFEEAMQNLRIS